MEIRQKMIERNRMNTCAYGFFCLWIDYDEYMLEILKNPQDINKIKNIMKIKMTKKKYKVFKHRAFPYGKLQSK